jgi:hypothetical protein
MATVVHTNWLQLMLGAAGVTGTLPDFDGDNIDASLLDETDSGTITAATVDYDEVDAADVVATGDVSVASISGGVVTLSGAVTFTAVTGDAADYLTVFKNSGTPASSPLIITWDSASTGLPVTPNGGDITATWGSNILVTLS